VSEHLCQGDWGGKISAKEILHFGKSGLGFLDILFLFFQPRREATRVRGRGEKEAHV
jgi:hypothetical protein